MKKVVRKFSSFAEADAAERAYYDSLTGQERIQILLQIIAPEIPEDATIERCVRIRSLNEDSGS